MSLAYLFDSNIQFQDKSGNNNVNGFLRVYIDNTDDRAVTYKDFNGTLNQADIRLDNNGRAVVIVDDSKTYRLEVYGTTGVLLWTLYPISPKATGINETLEALVAAVKSHTIAIEGLALGKKNKQQAKVISGTTTQTVKSLSQNADGEITVEFEDIAFPHKVLVDGEDSVPKHLEDAVMADELGKLQVYVGEHEDSTPEHPNKVLVIDDYLLREDIDNNAQRIENLEDAIAELDVDSVPRAYLASKLNQSPGDSVTTRTTIDVFSVTAIEGDCFEFEQTTTIDDTPFGYVWIEPGTYLINAAVTLQWVGNPRGTFIAKVGSVMGENFDFSQEQEISRQSTKVVTIPNRMKLAVNVTYDAGTPVMGFWISSMQVVKLAGGMSQTTVAHGLSLKGNGSVEDPLDISEHGLQETFDYAKNKSYFATKQEIVPLATQSSLQAETARATQRENEIEALFVLPTQEAVDAWLNAHPEATTTVEDNSLTEQKFTDDLALKTIKDYVTPEMFGAVGDGVTDDTAAFTAMVASSNKYLLTKTYAVSGVVIDKTFVMIGIPGNSIIALNDAQEFILRIDSGRNNRIVGIKFDGKGSTTPGLRGNVVGLLLNAASTVEFTLDSCTFNTCRVGILAPNTFWHSRVSMCRFNWCGYGIEIGIKDVSTNQSFLELLFSTIYCNQCDNDLYIDHGTNIEFRNCSFGNETVDAGSSFFSNWYAIRNLVFKSCNFEGCYVKNGNGAFFITSGTVALFQDCIFQEVHPVAGVSASTTALFRMALTSGNLINFVRCNFEAMSVDYVLYCQTGTRHNYNIDYYSISNAASVFPRKFDAKSVYDNSLHSFSISDVASVSSPPTSQPWASNLNRYFRGVIFHVNKTTDFYMWNGSTWEKLVYVPELANDENTYTLKNVAGTLTWVQDA